MGIVRTVKRENPFVQLDKQYIGTGELSLKATGLLTYFLSKPNHWQVRTADVINRFSDGEASVRAAFKELEEQKYIYKYQERKESGRLGQWVYEVYERPEYNPYAPNSENHHTVSPNGEKPNSEKPRSGKPNSENHHHSNNEFSNNDSSNNEISSSNSSSERQQALGKVFQFYDNNFGGTMSDYHRDFLGGWSDTLSPEIVHRALEETVMLGGHNLKYVTRILNDWHKANCKTIEDIEKHEEAKQNQRRSTNGWSKARHAGGHGPAASANGTGQAEPLFGNGRFKPKT